jgi:Gram-negative bacterial TonB protein C-terminal
LSLRSITVGLIVWLVLQTVPPVFANQNPVPNVRELYLSADYEGALTVLDLLDRPTGASHAELADYRVLCLLALDRRDDARQAIRAIVERDPAHRLSEGQASPRMQTAFRDLRKAVLPEIVQLMYAEAKTKFDKHDPSAADTFDRVMTLLDDPDLKDAQLLDLRSVASGFRDLSKAANATPVPQTTPQEDRLKADTTYDKPTAPLTGPPDKIRVTPEGASLIFSPKPAPPLGVEMALAVTQPMPQWSRRWIKTQLNYDSTLELTIDEQGNVTTAALQQPLHPMFDKALLKIAHTWKYTPARLNGTPVPFHKLVEIHIQPDR